MVNDGVVNTLKNKEPNFHLTNAIYTSKQQETKKTQSFDKAKKPSRPRHTYTPMVDTYEVILKTFLANNIITLLGNS